MSKGGDTAVEISNNSDDGKTNSPPAARRLRNHLRTVTFDPLFFLGRLSKLFIKKQVAGSRTTCLTPS
jgi:hypothetical protein